MTAFIFVIFLNNNNNNNKQSAIFICTNQSFLKFFYLFSRSQLPARATRLLNRSRVQTSAIPHSPAAIGSESPRSLDSFAARHKTANSSPRPSPHHHHYQQQQHLIHHHLAHHLLNSSPIGGGQTQSNSSLTSSEDNLIMLDKSMRNTMIQDVHQLKKDLLHLRSVLFDVRNFCFLVLWFDLISYVGLFVFLSF